MSRLLQQTLAWAMITLTVLTGCHPTKPFYVNEDGDLSHYLDVATDIEFADVDEPSLDEVCHTREPLTISNPVFDSIWDVTLEEAIRIALHNSKVIRTFGQVNQFGQIVSSAPLRLATAPDAVTTIYDPAIQETGQAGVEQALANFDTVFNFNTNYSTTDRPQNFNAPNIFAQILREDQVTINAELQKQTATGTQLFLRNANIYTDSNQTARALPSDWFTAVEAEARQPLLRGRGSQVNRIPVMLARIRTDQSLADFELSVRNQVNDIERAYWELYFFYRNMQSTKIGRDSALVTWKKVHALYQGGAPGGEAEKEAQAREQYFFFRAQVEQALRDLYKSETRLRYLLGLSATDGRLIRPIDEPTAAKLTFDWNEIHCESLIRSPELRRQKWSIKQRELELIASRNLLLPQLDAVMLYRWLGVGDRFNSFNRVTQDFAAVGSTAIAGLTDGNHQEGQIGIQLNVPIGFRRELASVRNSELLLARARAQLEDMELEVSHQLTDAVQELEAQYMIMQSNLNRRTAAERQVEAVEAAYEAGTVLLDLLLDSQRRRADAEIAFYQSVIEYNLALTTIHLRKGSLLEYDGVLLAEGPWPAKAYCDAHEKARQRDASYYLNYVYSRPKVASQGPFPQIKGNVGNEGRQELDRQESVDDHEPDDTIHQEIETLPPEANNPSEEPNGPLPIPAVPPEEPTDHLEPSKPDESTDSVPHPTNRHVGAHQQYPARDHSRKIAVGKSHHKTETGQPTESPFTPLGTLRQPQKPAMNYVGALDLATSNVLRDHVPTQQDQSTNGPRRQTDSTNMAAPKKKSPSQKHQKSSQLEKTEPARATNSTTTSRPTEIRLLDASDDSRVRPGNPAESAKLASPAFSVNFNDSANISQDAPGKNVTPIPGKSGFRSVKHPQTTPFKLNWKQ